MKSSALSVSKARTGAHCNSQRVPKNVSEGGLTVSGVSHFVYFALFLLTCRAKTPNPMQIAFLLNKEKATLLMTLRFAGNVVAIIRCLPEAGSWEQTVRKLHVLATKACSIQFILFISKHTCRG